MEYLNNLYKENGMYMLMACTYLLQIGFDRALNITDEEIARVKANTSENAIISADCNEWLMETARTLVDKVTPVQLLQWFQVNKPYDTKGIKKA